MSIRTIVPQAGAATKVAGGGTRATAGRGDGGKVEKLNPLNLIPNTTPSRHEQKAVVETAVLISHL